jgi:hypothetical protein
MGRKGERDPERERYWREVLTSREQSGLSVREYCDRERLSEASYYYWRREVARRDSERPSRRPRERGLRSTLPGRGRKPRSGLQPLFRELAIVGGPAVSVDRGLEIVLPDGCRVHVASEVDRALLADIFAALEARRC